MGVSHPNYPRLGGNQGWIKERDNGLKDWRDRGGNWRYLEVEKDIYIQPHDRPKTKEQVGLEGSTNDMLSRIFNKVEGFEKVLKDLKNEFSILTQTITSYSLSIKQLEIQMYF